MHPIPVFIGSITINVNPGELAEQLRQAVGDTVIDHHTGLQWTRGNLSGGRQGLDKAIATAAECRIGGHDDWRIPEREELLTLVDLKRHEPCIDTDAFPTCESAWYWSATPCNWAPAASAWVVSFNLGGAYDLGRDGYAFARAVRRVSARQ